MASSVGQKTCTWISPAGSETETLKILISPTWGWGPLAMGKVYLERLELYSWYVTWSARSLGADVGFSESNSNREKIWDLDTLIFGIDLGELGIHPVDH